MRYLTTAEVLELHREMVKRSGGASGIRDMGAVAQPQMTFSGQDLYPSLADNRR